MATIIEPELIITKDNFWNTDLEQIEAQILNGKKVTDLPITFDNRVPPSELMIEQLSFESKN